MSMAAVTSVAHRHTGSDCLGPVQSEAFNEVNQLCLLSYKELKLSYWNGGSLKHNFWNQAMCFFKRLCWKKNWKKTNKKQKHQQKTPVLQKGFPCYGSLAGKIHLKFEYFMTMRDKASSAVLWAGLTQKNKQGHTQNQFIKIWPKATEFHPSFS